MNGAARSNYSLWKSTEDLTIGDTDKEQSRTQMVYQLRLRQLSSEHPMSKECESYTRTSGSEFIQGQEVEPVP